MSVETINVPVALTERDLVSLDAVADAMNENSRKLNQTTVWNRENVLAVAALTGLSAFNAIHHRPAPQPA